MNVRIWKRGLWRRLRARVRISSRLVGDVFCFKIG